MARHEDRYACAEEWLAIVKRLWTEDDDFDHEGRFYKIKKGYLAPKPIQHPYPAIMNAGSSERGRHFATKNCDLVFTILRTFGLDACTRHVQAYHKLAREEYGREVRVWTNANIIQGETEKEARDFYDYYVHQKGDWEAAGNVIAMMAAEVNERKYPPEQARHDGGDDPRLGRPSADRHQGADRRQARRPVEDGHRRRGAVMAARFEAGMREFRDVTLPLVKQAGLRDAV